jgi:uncharacterized membrane protein YiaA
MNKRQLQAIVDYFSRAIVACTLMMWGVMNLATAVLTYLRSNSDEVVETAAPQNWGLSFSLALVIGLVPFLIGSWILQKLFRESKPPATKN